MEIGERIARLRKEKGLKQGDLARLAGIPLSTLNYVERGIRQGDGLSIATAKRLARALGVTLDYLSGMYDEQESMPTSAALVGA
jgi:transcriptional regulator with XRE-family HTH domain